MHLFFLQINKVPPVRSSSKSLKKKDIKASASVPIPKPKKLKSYDYDAWDKLDVVSVLNSLVLTIFYLHVSGNHL